MDEACRWRPPRVLALPWRPSGEFADAPPGVMACGCDAHKEAVASIQAVCSGARRPPPSVTLVPIPDHVDTALFLSDDKDLCTDVLDPLHKTGCVPDPDADDIGWQRAVLFVHLPPDFDHVHVRAVLRLAIMNRDYSQHIVASSDGRRALLLQLFPSQTYGAFVTPWMSVRGNKK